MSTADNVIQLLTMLISTVDNVFFENNNDFNDLLVSLQNF